MANLHALAFHDAIKLSWPNWQYRVAYRSDNWGLSSNQGEKKVESQIVFVAVN